MDTNLYIPQIHLVILQKGRFFSDITYRQNIKRGNKIMKIRGRLLLLLIIILIATTSCSPKLMTPDKDLSTGNEYTYTSSDDLLMSYKENVGTESTTELSSPLEKEATGLKYILRSYLDMDSVYFIGDENKYFLEYSLIANQNPFLPISAENWEKAIRIIFSFDDSNKQEIKMYIHDFVKNDKIERQYAVSGLMKLLSLRYGISLGSDDASIQKSEIIPDLDEIDEKHQYLVRQAYCLGFTDFSVDKGKLFRPFDYLSYGETVSMLYRILSNLGLPGSEQANRELNAQVPVIETSPADDTSSSGSYSIEGILLEYNEYKADLRSSSKSSSKKRLEMLHLAESIIGINLDGLHAIDRPLGADIWAKILDQVFGLEYEDIDSYLSVSTDGTLPYDIAAISIMKASNKLLGYGPRDADEKELEEARAAIPQFDTARDDSKFAQMFSSGLLEGLYTIPGFTPQRPVSEIEALLLVKRITEGFKVK